MNSEHLHQLGLSPNEAKVFSNLLNSAARPASTIAKSTKINRTSVYNALKSLSDRGFIATFNQNSIAYFKAKDPNCLLSYIESQKNRLNSYQNLVASYISDQKSQYKAISHQEPSVSIAKNSKELPLILQEANGELQVILHENQLQFLPRRLDLKLIVWPNIKRKMPPWLKYKILPQNFQINLIILKNEIFSFHQEAGSDFTIQTQSATIAGSYNILFENLWKNLPSPPARNV